MAAIFVYIRLANGPNNARFQPCAVYTSTSVAILRCFVLFPVGKPADKKDVTNRFLYTNTVVTLKHAEIIKPAVLK